MGLYGEKSLNVSHHPAKFCGHNHCGSGDTWFLVCHEISQGHMIKGSCDFIGRSPPRLVTVLPSLVAISTVVVEM